MSAFGGKADIDWRSCYFRFLRKSDIGDAATMTNPDVAVSRCAIRQLQHRGAATNGTDAALTCRCSTDPAGNFWANPSRQFDLVVFVRQFDFGHNQPLIFTRKYVDFPAQLAVGNDMSDLFDDAAPP